MCLVAYSTFGEFGSSSLRKLANTALVCYMKNAVHEFIGSMLISCFDRFPKRVQFYIMTSACALLLLKRTFHWKPCRKMKLNCTVPSHLCFRRQFFIYRMKLFRRLIYSFRYCCCCCCPVFRGCPADADDDLYKSEHWLFDPDNH